MSRPSTEAARLRLLAALVVLAATVPYLNSLGGDFTYDDAGVIRDNPTVQVGSVTRIATTPEYLGMAYYRPLTLATYAADARLWRSATGYHAVNVALHALVSLLLFRLALVLLGSTFAATAAALLFAVHPIHTEAVSSIVGRAEVLAGLLVLTTLLSFLRGRENQGARRRVWQAVSCGAFGLGILAKESALTAVLLIPLVDLCLRAPEARRSALRNLLPYVTIATAYLALRWRLIGSVGLPDAPGLLENPLAHVATLPRLMTATVVFWEYVSALAFPVRLAADYSFNQVPVVLSALEPRFLLAATAASVTLGGALVLARRAAQVWVALLFLLVPMTLTANVLFPIGTIKAERLLYLPSVGWCLGLGYLAERAARRRLALCLIACAVFTAAYGARTWSRNRDWRDDLTLFTATVHASPASAKAHYNLGVNYEREGRLEDAAFHYRRALSILPEFPAAARAIGVVHERKASAAGALHWYERALELDWSSAKVHLQTGLFWRRLGNYDTAEAAFRSGLESAPEDPLLLVSLSAVRLDQGDFWDALAVLRRLDEVGPGAGETAEVVAAARREVEDRLR